MIKKLKLVNFRNFDNLILDNLNKQNFIIWENWKWKTNILEAISLIWNNSICWLSLNELIKKWENYFFIEYHNEFWDKIWFSYSKEQKENEKIVTQKKYIVNNKSVTKKKFLEYWYKTVIFSPIIMNMMYLWPSLRRDFLDNILKSSFEEYENILNDYKKILKSRNKLLQNIEKQKSQIDELDFWNTKFIEKASIIYKYRFKIINFLKESILYTKEYFENKVENIELIYKTKIKEENIEKQIKEYLEKNIKRDIILWKTPIWPHIDDFEIILDWFSLTHFASRWETKSIIIWLKLLEWIFIEKMTNKKAILIIDDLLSELDNKHKDLLLKKIEYYQSFISSIVEYENYNQNKDLLNIIKL